MGVNDEKREYFRIRDRLPVEFRVISLEEFTKLEDIIRQRPTEFIDRAKGFYFLDAPSFGKEDEKLYSYLRVINKKLDMIIKALGGQAREEHYNVVFTELDISGAGMRFNSDVELSDGDLVECKLVIPVFPYSEITALCQVVRVESVGGGDIGGKSRVAMKFMVIHEKDRDSLINYIFMKNRECLRQDKEVKS